MLRCFTSLTCADAAQFHCFADTSKFAYGFVVYLLTYQAGYPALSFVAGKSRLLPTECTTTPRAELHAADEAAKFAMTLIKRELYDARATEPACFWCNSQTILGYLKNPDKRLPVFEANRVKLIMKLTMATQWRWANAKHNPADYFSRGVDPSKVKHAKNWLDGPSFLLDDEEKWPSSATATLSTVDCNVTSYAQISINVNFSEEDTLSNRLIAHYSSLPRLLRATTWWLRLKQILRDRSFEHKTTRVNSEPVSVAEYEVSLAALISVTQKAEIEDVYEMLSETSRVTSKEKLLETCTSIIACISSFY